MAYRLTIAILQKALPTYWGSMAARLSCKKHCILIRAAEHFALFKLLLHYRVYCGSCLPLALPVRTLHNIITLVFTSARARRGEVAFRPTKQPGKCLPKL